MIACYNSAIPYLCPELPEDQVRGLSYNVKIPPLLPKPQLSPLVCEAPEPGCNSRATALTTSFSKWIA
jgi:hypothetical protein